MKKIFLFFILIQSLSSYSQSGFRVIETDRTSSIKTINTINTVVVNNPNKNINVYYRPDVTTQRLFNIIILKIDKLQDSQDKINKELKKHKKLNDFELMKKNVQVRYKYIESNMDLISKDTALVNRVIPIRNIYNSLDELKDYSKNYTKKIGFMIEELEKNPYFVFRSDFSDGYYKVCLNNRCSYLDREGNLVKEFIYEKNSRNFYEGFAYVETTFEGNFIINTKFERILNVTDFDEINDYKYGTAIFKKGATKGIITKKGKVIDYKKSFGIVDSLNIGQIFKTKNNKILVKVKVTTKNHIPNNISEKLSLNKCVCKYSDDKQYVYSSYYFLFESDSNKYSEGPFVSYRYDKNKGLFYFQNCDNSSAIFSEKQNRYIINHSQSNIDSIYHIDNYNENFFSASNELILDSYGNVLGYDNYKKTNKNSLAFLKLGKKYPITKFKYCNVGEFTNNLAIVKICNAYSDYRNSITNEGVTVKYDSKFFLNDTTYVNNDYWNKKEVDDAYGVIENNGLEIIRPIFKHIERKGKTFICYFFLEKKFKIVKRGIFKRDYKWEYSNVKVTLDKNGKCLSGDCDIYNHPRLKE